MLGNSMKRYGHMVSSVICAPKCVRMEVATPVPVGSKLPTGTNLGDLQDHREVGSLRGYIVSVRVRVMVKAMVSHGRVIDRVKRGRGRRVRLSCGCKEYDLYRGIGSMDPFAKAFP